MPAALASARRPEQLGLHSTQQFEQREVVRADIQQQPPQQLSLTSPSLSSPSPSSSSSSSPSSSPAYAVNGKPLAAHLKTLHQKASRALILGQGSAAWSHCCEAIQYCNIERLTCEYGEQQARELCCRLWILYICVLSSLTELAAEDGRLQVKRGAKDASTAALQKLPATVRDVWDMIMTAFGGYAGNVDSEVLVPTVLLCLKLRDAKTARDIVEAWLATLSDETMYLLQESGNADNTNGSSKSILGTRPGVVSHQQHKTMVQASYLRVCELYALHILPQLNDFTSAYEFLNMCTAVSATTRDGFVKRLDSLRSPAPVKKRAKNRSKKQSAKPKATAAPKAASGSSEQASGSTAAMVPAEAKQAVSAAYVASNPNANANANANADRDGDEASAKSTALPSLASVYAKSKHSTSNGNSSSGTGSSGRSRTRPGVKTRALVRKPKSTISIVWQVVRRLMSRWGFTLFTLAIVAAVLRMLTQRFRLPPLFNAITRKLWNTIKMGTQVTYI